MNKKVLVLGAGGFIGHHMVNELKKQGCYVRGVDLKSPEFEGTKADSFEILDLSNDEKCADAFDQMYDEVYQFAADMGGAGYLFTGDCDFDIMHNSVAINVNVLRECKKHGIKKILYASSACVYPEYNQEDPNNPYCEENSVYPAEPDSEYGWEKLFSERLYAAYNKNCGGEAHVVRFHNVFGPLGTWTGGKEKSPAAICRKIAEADTSIEVWGSGEQTRSFLFIEEAITGLVKIMDSDYLHPLNLGSDEMVSINTMASIVKKIAGKEHITNNHIDGPEGVAGRNSHNVLIKEVIGWAPSMKLEDGLTKTYEWILARTNDL